MRNQQSASDPRHADTEWAIDVEKRLNGAPIPMEAVRVALSDAHRAGFESGQPLRDLFGSPEEYVELITEDVPLELQAAVDVTGISRSDRWRILVACSGVCGLLISFSLLLLEGWSLILSPAVIALSFGSVAAWAALVLSSIERSSGRISRGWLWLSVAVFVFAASIVIAAVSQDSDSLTQVPTVGLIAASLVVLAATYRLPLRSRSRSMPTENLTALGWYSRLAGLLRGRYALSHDQVKKIVHDAESLANNSQKNHPEIEFDTPESYAAQLMGGSIMKAGRQRRTESWIYIAITVVFASSTVNAIITNTSLWLTSLFGLGFIIFAVMSTRLLWSTKK
ncbi:hypothetical protein [Arthrobacter flavus]|uniref:DUF2157 domain-containing protein n=1 Tax=Arthrobacter flavus TaxID=95172 RepID=A0ABW4Q4G5_9MICC